MARSGQVTAGKPVTGLMCGMPKRRKGHVVLVEDTALPSCSPQVAALGSAAAASGHGFGFPTLAVDHATIHRAAKAVSRFESPVADQPGYDSDPARGCGNRFDLQALWPAPRSMPCIASACDCS